jgi:thiosulfate dehydrogenase [quinone] large subunit
MNRSALVAATVLRLVLGWYMFIDGMEALLTPGWSAAGFLTNAQNAHMFYAGFYNWFASPTNLWWVNPINAWGITLIGVALLLGAGSRLAAWGGATLMLLYYFPHYTTLPIVPHGFIVDDHIIYAAVFVLIALWAPARSFGIGKYLQAHTFLGRIPIISSLLV